MSWQDVGEVLLRVGFGRNSSRAYSRRDHHGVHQSTASSSPRPSRSSQLSEGVHIQPLPSCVRNVNSSALEPTLAEFEESGNSSAKATLSDASSDEETSAHISGGPQNDDDHMLHDESRGGESDKGKDRVSDQEKSQPDECWAASRDVEKVAISDAFCEPEETGVTDIGKGDALDEEDMITEGIDLTTTEDVGAVEQSTNGLYGSLVVSREVEQKVPPICDHPPSVLAATISSMDAVNSAAESLAIRSEVESILTSMLADVEICHSLSMEVRQRSAVLRLEHELQVARRALEELSELKDAESKQRAQLGDRFIEEVVGLSSELSDLEHWKQDNEEKVQRYEDIRKELEISRERVKFLEKENVEEAATFCVEDEDDQAAESEACTIANEGTISDSIPPTGPATSSVERNEDSGEQCHAEAPELHSAQQSSSEERSQQSQIEEEMPSLEIVPEPALLCMFAYLEAQDILSVAEVNITLYSRVDTLFGLGGGDDVGEGDESKDDVAAKKEASILMPPKDHPASSASTVCPPKGQPPPSSPTVASVASLPSTDLSQPPPSSPTVASIASLPSTDHSSNAFSRIWPGTAEPTQKQHGKRPSGVGDSITVAGPAAKSVATELSASSAGVLTSDMASSMAAKLAPAELAVIISMQEKLRDKDNEVRKLQQEKDDFMAEMQGIEAVKDFLVKKLRDVEGAKTKGEEDAAKTARQVASDQEVIAFLDERVQELEQSNSKLESANSRAEEEIKILQQKGREKVCVLEDMLKFERDQLGSSEKEWKVTKKVLVKEVKHCRRNILSLEAERDGLEEQIAKLKDALLARRGGSPF